MKELKLTCPFTGVPFKALLSSDDSVYFIHPLTGETLRAKYHLRENTIELKMSDCAYIETLTPKQAQDILEITKQRVSQIVATNVIPVHRVAGQIRFRLDDVLLYKETRSVGAPKKENN